MDERLAQKVMHIKVTKNRMERVIQAPEDVVSFGHKLPPLKQAEGVVFKCSPNTWILFVLFVDVVQH